MKKHVVVMLALVVACGLTASVGGGGVAIVYTDIANVFTANQRINAGLGVNVTPGATGTITTSAGATVGGVLLANGGISTVSGANPAFRLSDTVSTVDARNWRIIASAGSLYFQPFDDAFVTGSGAYTVDRAGNATAVGKYYERGRAAAMGDWTNVAYASGNFTGSAGTTWTVASGDQTTYKYMLVGRTMYVDVRIDGSSIVGSPVRLRVAVPGGFVVNASTNGLCMVQNAAVWTVGSWDAIAGTSLIGFYTSVTQSGWTAGVDESGIQAKVYFEVQ